ncbi:hypothetical protein NC997_22490 [Trichocoleus sp. DQ-A2]|uniref:hypothetical protein n=1 Tax=Cyanophyceae TaxID=3028117 RepID=UPI0016889755|nr:MULTISPECIES: hypothetical protein [unclassified Coleofasciculus]MBD1877439.1 hypothetical protein [Coleofasciculus sp. FACHB-T130]MBD1899950.1 hypothetical protein [Coleofasciculus sp. FACHB-125]
MPPVSSKRHDISRRKWQSGLDRADLTPEPASLPPRGGLGRDGEGLREFTEPDWQLSRKSDRMGEMECLYLHRRYPAPCWLCPTI